MKPSDPTVLWWMQGQALDHNKMENQDYAIKTEDYARERLRNSPLHKLEGYNSTNANSNVSVATPLSIIVSEQPNTFIKTLL